MQSHSNEISVLSGCWVSNVVLAVVGAVEGDPVESKSLFVVVVVRVVEVLPYVALCVDVVLVQVVVHVDVGEVVADLWRIVIRNGREGIEKIGINSLCLGHSIPLFLLGLLFVILHVWLHNVEVEREDAWVEQQVGAPAHSSESAQCVRSETHLFLLIIIF